MVSMKMEDVQREREIRDKQALEERGVPIKSLHGELMVC